MLKLLTKKKKFFRIYNCTNFKRFMFLFGMMPPHPGIFIKKKIYEKYGLYNEKFKNAGDFEFLCRVLYKKKNEFLRIDKNLVTMTSGGKSNTGVKSILLNSSEISQSLKINKIFSNYFFILLRLPFKILQLLKF